MMKGHSGKATPQRVTDAVRTICDCQVHPRRERALWRRSFRFARIARGSLKAAQWLVQTKNKGCYDFTQVLFG